jgi:ABC-type dipeptide/oligopeptide/nickel transport system ATPase component
MQNNHDIRPGQSIELLKELHVLTRDGKLNQDSKRKLKQIYHLYNFLHPILKKSFEKNPDFSLVDHGAGKSYLGFILYDLFFKDINTGSVIGVETRDELVLKSIALKDKLKFNRMKFINTSVAESLNNNLIKENVEIVTALHACDTATDDAIKFAINKKADFVVIIPCCQAEVASVLRKNKNESFKITPLSELWRHPLHTREIGSSITNTLRCLLLESYGYKITVTEFIGFEHSMKNELIIAEKHSEFKKSSRERALAILKELNLSELESRFCW